MPSGWTAISFNTGGWSQASDAGSDIGAALPGTNPITQNSGAVPVSYGWALRHKFALRAGVISNATITLRVEDLLDELFVNNHFLGSITSAAGTENEGFNQQTFPIPTDVLVPQGVNVIAMTIRNSSGNRTHVSYSANIQFSA